MGPDYVFIGAGDCVFLAMGLKTELPLINPDVNIKAETMAEKLNLKVMELLDGKQLSISGLSRELKAEGIEEHRLVLTGYLRALRDLELLEESEVPPSKIYALPEKDGEALPEKGSELEPAVPSDSEDIYLIFRTQLLKIDLDFRIPVGVYIISRLFERPCFRRELKLAGITQKHLDQYMEKPGTVCEVSDSSLKKARVDITKIEIPTDDPAYELRENREEITRLANEVLAGMIRHRMDLEGLVAKSKQTTLLP
ncbi:hypothetical protein ACSAZL_04955 [Methanosarcina sp. T3]|uniref:hypothetical protein n=1 Tax=Methanosarcina sp. T3 TaxID=3439062 RepID=UPI003F86F145